MWDLGNDVYLGEHMGTYILQTGKSLFFFPSVDHPIKWGYYGNILWDLYVPIESYIPYGNWAVCEPENHHLNSGSAFFCMFWGNHQSQCFMCVCVFINKLFKHIFFTACSPGFNCGIQRVDCMRFATFVHFWEWG